MTNSFDAILAYEANELTIEQAIVMFTQLIDSGEIWRLPTDYLDAAGVLIVQGRLKKIN